jgi:N-acetylmuramoyl-L-alanine amidase
MARIHSLAFAVISALVCASTALADDFPVASDVRLGGDAKETRFVMDLSEKVDIAAFTLANPYRVVVDLPQVAFNLPSKTGEAGRGLIKAFRYGLVMQGGSRIVIDAKGPVRLEKSFVLPPADGQPARLVLDLVATDREAFLRNAELQPKPVRAPPRVKAPPVSEDGRPLVVIDPGHGGIDNGTKAASGELEKTIVLDFATILRDKLQQSGKYRVVMTRSDDTFVPLTERVRFARSQRASLFISIHADYLPKQEGEAQGS